jgi:DNA-binding transcriptional ArsR family regulator
LRWGLSEVAEGLQVSAQSVRRGLHTAERAGLLSVERKAGRKPVVTILDLAGSGVTPEYRPLRGPIPWAWWLEAARCSGKALQLAMVCWLFAGWERSAKIELAWDDWPAFGLTRFAVYRALDALERAGLIEVIRRAGRSPVVIILDPLNAPERNGTPSGSSGLP